MVWVSPVIPWDKCSEERRAALYVAWTRGDLSYKLHPDQLAVYHAIKASWLTVKSSLQRVYCLDVSRQWGKDYLTSVLLVERLCEMAARDEPGRVPYAAPTRDEIKELLVPTLESVFDDCPPDLLPKEMREGSFKKSANALTWPSGRQRLVLVGCDLHPQRLRGPASAAFAFTEAGFMDIERNLGIVQPQLLTKPDAFGLCVSTPPETPAHDWSNITLPRAASMGMVAHKTIYDNPSLSEEQVAGAIAAFGGKDSDKARRELFCEHIASKELLVIPEFQAVKGTSDGKGSYVDGIITREYEVPQYRDCYVALDPGWSDMCAALFGFWDFERAILVIEDDYAEAAQNSRQVAEIIKAKEKALWSDTNTTSWKASRMQPAPHKRVSDTDMRMIADLDSEHGLRFVPTAKDDRDAAINALRLRIQARKILIHPRCKTLIAHLDRCVWNRNRTEFARSGTFGHFDAVAALTYLDRNIDRTRNPNPPNLYGVETSRMLVHSTAMTSQQHNLASLFPRRTPPFKRRGSN